MERYIYLDGEFFDRVNNTAEEMADSLGARIEKVEPYDCPMCGDSEKVYLTKKASPEVDRVTLSYLNKKAFNPSVVHTMGDLYNGDDQIDAVRVGEQIGTVVVKTLMDERCDVTGTPNRTDLQVLEKDRKIMRIKYSFESEAEDHFSKKTQGYDSAESRADSIEEKLEAGLLGAFGPEIVERPSVEVKYRRNGPDDIDLENVNISIQIEAALSLV
jgi:hypothetical protein